MPEPPRCEDGSLSTDVLTAALAYISRGFHVVPCDTRTKRPAVPWKQYTKVSPTEAQVRRWFSPADQGGDGYGGIALIVGPGGLGVRDFDDPDAFLKWFEANPLLGVSLPSVKTPHGIHKYFKVPDGYALDGIIVDPNGAGELRLSGWSGLCSPEPRRQRDTLQVERAAPPC